MHEFVPFKGAVAIQRLACIPKTRLLFTLIALIPSLAAAATLTLTPTADAYVQAGTNATRNYGSATTLRIRTSGTTANNYDSYLKFDTSSATGTVTSAKLRVYAKLSASGAVSTTAYAISTTTWGETSITWNNKPALGSVLGNISVTSTSYAWKEIDVTAYVQGEFNANRKVVSFAYHSGTASSLLTTLQSREGTNKPQLVVVTNAAPTVSLTAPANNSSYVAPASVTLSANAADTDGAITSVAFYNGATLLNTDTSTPYSYTWTNVASGSYTLTAKATDNAGAVTTSSPVNISVNPVPNVPPTVSLTAPANNASYTAPASVNLTANATDSDGSITQVAYYNGATLIGQATSAPYSYTWTNVATGSYTLTAQATDNAGAITTSSPITISVNANQAPSVSLLAPSATDSFTAPATFSIVANAADSDGSVQLVEFYNGATLLGSKTQNPYTYDWTNVAAGSYALTAKAYDNANASTTSAPVTITVNAAQVAPGIYYIYADHLNTPRVITDSANKTVWRWDSDPFGMDMPYEDPDGDGIKFVFNQRFPGQYFDKETGLHYNYFRDYDPGTGRYVQSDPIGLEGGINTYAYVGGNPLSRDDPEGKLYSKMCGRCKITYDSDQWKGAHTHWECPGEPRGCIKKDGGLCDGSSPPPPEVKQCLINWGRIPDEKPKMCEADCKEKAATLVVTAGGAYIVYRCIRMIPSVIFPPAWPTIPANAAIP